MKILMVASEALPFAKTGAWPTSSARCRWRWLAWDTTSTSLCPRYRGVTAGSRRFAFR